MATNTFPEYPPDWANLKVLHLNTLPSRADFHLYDSEKTALARDISAARSFNLSGTWKFNLAKSPFAAPQGFEDPTLDSSTWSDIAVPGMWQLQNFGKGPQYTNVQFPFFVDPPNPPFTENECGSYITHFKVPEAFKQDQLRLRFEGVDSAFRLYVNGKEVGYSQGARNPSEFDITGFINKNEENVLAVRVYQYCDGSYIEDQDQWWLSGIFRDVHLIGFPQQSRIEDVDIQTLLDDEYKNANLKVQVSVTKTASVSLKLLDADQSALSSVSKSANGDTNESINFSIPVNDPKKWTAETPYLYTLIISADEKVFTSHRVGFRRVELQDGLIKVNGKRIIFKGANRHEHHPQFGRAVPYEFMKQDLLLMKQHNLNAIRTSHQPSDPRLYNLADELGLWVMDEADLECHGFETIEDAALEPEQRSLPFFERQQLTRANAAKWTSDNPEWCDAYVDRAKHLVHRDKLHPSVVVWSLGNESFYGQNHTAMIDWIRSYDPTRLIHYEPDLEAKYCDMYSRMYPAVQDIIKFGRDESKKKPLVLCEYIHAMGTGPGNIEEYVKAFYEYPKLQGGFVWEWANHGLLSYNSDGKPFYAYGGDFGDAPNDYNFVMDGVCNSDHTPNSGLLEYKKALEPVQVVSSNAEECVVINRYDFVTLDHLSCYYSVVREDGKHHEGGYVSIPSGLQPGELAKIPLPKVTFEDNRGEALLQLSFSLKDSTPWAKAGFEVANAQIQLTPISQVAEAVGADLLHNEQDGTILNISNKKCHWTFNLAHGHLTSWKKENHEVLSSPLEPSFYRAPTDNDTPKDGAEWKDRMLHLAKVHSREAHWRRDEGKVCVSLKQKFAPPVLSWSLDLTTEYEFSPEGSVRVHVQGTPTGRNLPSTLPRIGVTMGLPKEFQQVSWFGRGPGESYRDMKSSQLVGLHSFSSISDLWINPEYPQECSNRTDTRWLQLSSPETTLTAQFYKPEDYAKRHLFDFMASHYDVDDIDAAQHPYELEKKKREDVVLRLDAQHHGLGTGSCGPKTLDEYALKTEKFEFGLLLY